MKIEADRELVEIIDSTSKWRAEGVSWSQIATRLNDRGLRNSNGDPWTPEAINMRWSRTDDPGAAIQRVDTAAGRLKLGLHLLEMVAAGTGEKASEAKMGLYIYHDGIKNGLAPIDAADLAKTCVMEERARRRQERNND